MEGGGRLVTSKNISYYFAFCSVLFLVLWVGIKTYYQVMSIFVLSQHIWNILIYNLLYCHNCYLWYFILYFLLTCLLNSKAWYNVIFHKNLKHETLYSICIYRTFIFYQYFHHTLVISLTFFVYLCDKVITATI